MYTFDENIARLEEAKNDIKAAIEEKGVVVGNGLINTYANKIKMIKSSGKSQTKTETITENNSTVSILPDDGYMLDKVVVKTEIPIESKSVEYNRNGNYTITPEEGVEGYDNINVNVDVPIQETKDITINSNGHYDVAPDVDNLGIAKVSIDVDVKADGKTVLPNGICLSGSTWETFDTTQYDWSKIRSFAELFGYCTNLTSLDVSNWDTSKVTAMNEMFRQCSNLTSLDVSNWDTSNVTDMSYMFGNCSNLTSLDVSNWDTSNVTDMAGVFYSCSKLTSIDVSNLNTSKVTDMDFMFSSCSNLTEIKGMENWDTSNVTDMYYLFNGCSNLASIDVSNWDTSKVTNMNGMFGSCTSLTEVKMGGDVSKVTDVANMFSYIKTTGTFYYNSQYDYSKIIAQLPSTWTAVPME